MKIQGDGVQIYISDESPTAQKIKDGYDYTISQEGEIIFSSSTGEIKNKYQAIKELKKVKTIEEIKIVLEKVLSDIL